MRGKKGFTLIELVVTIAILGIIAGIGVPRMMEYFKVSRGHRMIADLRMLDSAIGYYIAQHGEPPTSLDVLVEAPAIIAAVPEKLGADFIVKQNNGTEKEYTGTESWQFGLNTETNRAYYGGDTTQNLEFYLNGGSSGPSYVTSLQAAAGLVFDYRTGSMHLQRKDSGYADTTSSDYAQLLQAAGLGDFPTWSAHGGQGSCELILSSVDITNLKHGTFIPVMTVSFDKSQYDYYNMRNDLAHCPYTYYAYIAMVSAPGNVPPGIASGNNGNGQNGVEIQANYGYDNAADAAARYEKLLQEYQTNGLDSSKSNTIPR